MGEQEADISESLKILHDSCETMLSEFSVRAEGELTLLGMLQGILSNSETLSAIEKNDSLRVEAKASLDSVVELMVKSNPTFAKRLELFQDQCLLMIRMIEQANKEGLRIK